MQGPKHKAEPNTVNSKSGAAPTRHRAAKKIPKKITETYLHNSGLYYLQRFSASTAHFKSVMMRKVKKSCMAHPDQDFEACRAMVDALATRFEGSGLLNDAVYARGVADSLRRRGRSRKAITAKMTERGLRKDQIETALESLRDESGVSDSEAELAAALKFARRKRIGPFRAGEQDPALLRKDLAALARAGFSYDTARKALDYDGDEAF